MHGPCRCVHFPIAHGRPCRTGGSLPLSLGVRQAAVRSFLAREAARQAVRESWDEQAGTWAVDAHPPDATAGSPGTHDPLFAGVIGAFLFFYTPRKDAARARLVCQLMSRLLRGAPCTPPTLLQTRSQLTLAVIPVAPARRPAAASCCLPGAAAASVRAVVPPADVRSPTESGCGCEHDFIWRRAGPGPGGGGCAGDD